MREQRIARIRDATVTLIAAADVGMCGLGQPPEGGIDLRRLERAFHWQVQDLALLLIVVVEIQLKQTAPFSRIEVQANLILRPPRPAGALPMLGICEIDPWNWLG